MHGPRIGNAMAQHVPSAVTAKRRRGGYILAATGAILFSMKAILVKLAYGQGSVPEADAITLLALRMAFSLPFYAVIGVMGLRAHTARGLPLPSGRLAIKIVLVGFIGYYLSSYLDFAGLQYLSAQLERLILMTYPVFVALLGAAFFGARLTLWGLAALFVTYSGIVFIFAEGATAKGGNAVLGAFLVFCASFTYALYQLIARPLVAAIGTRLFTSIAMLAACAGVMLHYAATNSLNQLASASPRVLWLSAVMAIASTVLPSFMISASLARVGPQAVSMIGSISPVATIVMAMAFLDEPFTAADAAGTALVIAGIGLFTYQDARRH
jgi:drug/metabolite transporter (DMT)-like permease